MVSVDGKGVFKCHIESDFHNVKFSLSVFVLSLFNTCWWIFFWKSIKPPCIKSKWNSPSPVLFKREFELLIFNDLWFWVRVIKPNRSIWEFVEWGKKGFSSERNGLQNTEKNSHIKFMSLWRKGKFYNRSGKGNLYYINFSNQSKYLEMKYIKLVPLCLIRE